MNHVNHELESAIKTLRDLNFPPDQLAAEYERIAAAEALRAEHLSKLEQHECPR